MAFVDSLTLSPLEWCIWLIIAMFSVTLTVLILRSECKKRRLDSSWFASDNLRITSAVSIGFGVVAAVQSCLDLFPGACMLQYTLSPIERGAQFIFMGFYQLSRLHYCFSKNSTHHDSGYPKWVFIMMVTAGIVLFVLRAILLSFGRRLPSSCGFKRDSSFEWTYSESSILFPPKMEEQRIQLYLNILIGVMTSSWDIATLLLYCYKIKTFRKIRALRRDAVWRKIIFVLQRIIIITLFYQISTLILNGALKQIPVLWLSVTMKYTIRSVSGGLLVILYSISTYLMMEHNADEYLRFLHCLKRSYLKYICFCCCHRMVDQQLSEFDLMTLEARLEKINHEPKSITSTWFPNASKNVNYSRNRGCSSPTLTGELDDEKKE